MSLALQEISPEIIIIIEETTNPVLLNIRGRRSIVPPTIELRRENIVVRELFT